MNFNSFQREDVRFYTVVHPLRSGLVTRTEQSDLALIGASLLLEWGNHNCVDITPPVLPLRRVGPQLTVFEFKLTKSSGHTVDLDVGCNQQDKRDEFIIFLMS